MCRTGVLPELQASGVAYIGVVSANDALAKFTDPGLVQHASMAGSDIYHPKVNTSFHDKVSSQHLLIS